MPSANTYLKFLFTGVGAEIIKMAWCFQEAFANAPSNTAA